MNTILIPRNERSDGFFTHREMLAEKGTPSHQHVMFDVLIGKDGGLWIPRAAGCLSWFDCEISQQALPAGVSNGDVCHAQAWIEGENIALFLTA